MRKLNILVVEDDEFSLDNLKFSLSPKYNVFTSSKVQEAVEIIDSIKIDIAIIDIKLPGDNGLSVIEQTNEKYPNLKFIVITGYSDEETIINSLRLGAHDLLKKPYEESELHNSVSKLEQSIILEDENRRLKEKLVQENIILRKELDKNLELKEEMIIGESHKLRKVLQKSEQIAAHSINTLICGENGTGKELLARHIHKISPRRNKPFVPINCASLTPTLFESELFGHEKGSFTNANSSRAGLFEAADGGILFLDEITEIDSELQAKLLRVVEEKEVQRIGSNNLIPVDVQVLSSSNRDISESLKEGILREDLYHRLAGSRLDLPPLRERKEDLTHLLKHFLLKYQTLFQVDPIGINSRTMELISNSEWSGNIRQLSNFVKNWVLFGKSASEEDITDWMKSKQNGIIRSTESFHFEKGDMHELEEAKKWLINRALRKYEGNKTKAAEHLGVSYAGFLKMLKNL